MKKISWVTHPQYDIPLPKNHKFTSSKFSDLLSELEKSGLSEYANIFYPEKAAISDLLKVHDRNYIDKILNGTLDPAEERRLGLKWSPELSNRSFLAVNGTLLTAKLAMKEGIACHVAGGTHHSHFDFGSGYCVFNDLAYTSRSLIENKIISKVLIFDCDVHQGDGTAKILEKNNDIFTCSIHCKNNFPARKAKSDLDVELEDNLEDKDYLETLKFYLNKLNKENFDFVFYIAGVDIHFNDRLGKLKITDDGIKERDELITQNFYSKGIPLCGVLGGGYNKDFDKLVELHSLLHQSCAKLIK